MSYVCMLCMYAMYVCAYKSVAQFFFKAMPYHCAVCMYVLYVCMYAGRLLNRLLQLSWMF
jgi:hypothetical protein